MSHEDVLCDNVTDRVAGITRNRTDQVTTCTGVPGDQMRRLHKASGLCR
jgi:hypothetical protein